MVHFAIDTMPAFACAGCLGFPAAAGSRRRLRRLGGEIAGPRFRPL
jgi:hypothetical protein